MPELPEVEHQARALRRILEGARIERAEADATPVLKGKTTPATFAEALAGRSLERIERVGKQLLLSFDAGTGLACHLGMTGKWRSRVGDEPPRHGRARLFLHDGCVLDYVDMRMLGRLEIVPRDAFARIVSSLGPDPLRDGLDASRLAARIAGTPRPIKNVLLDQTVLAGLGNIHATEALFRARVHPSRAADSLTPAEVEALADGILATITHALAAHERDDEIVYLSDRTDAPNPFLVYGRASEPCPRCGTPIRTLTIAGRTSPFCPRCQRLIQSGPRRGR
ncbi:bifunctional DNA-formamidopyrimidine glycosylase/DNA-(apurinic or apyrimidinic site) lyase [Polyangium jinanense]|uniref:Formamidopyrimidine-DNA glycosylase n=1 Tax=Polyangium jinanense TaxID=2829994 RepID=A0A9X4AWF8_9BACT|nr:bifunctional DNA-formamidopyrimidine glycosylase/DNA-(apurinic or apyrimidinic site) lyase [Polyangium jinanense]MDC3958724.1 bifunctional DNA-formamidopyrimidine glycosylase/DNA-(apurinic or apyrimidinic site) lyase [Polyangium jinanense]MDC3985295.1 bifunctional DNA-formamidopyrimidine glycosylase/DNA-(apurinic or apyrimidinic site) lyase [Polyangium jinanense]